MNLIAQQPNSKVSNQADPWAWQPRWDGTGQTSYDACLLAVLRGLRDWVRDAVSTGRLYHREALLCFEDAIFAPEDVPLLQLASIATGEPVRSILNALLPQVGLSSPGKRYESTDPQQPSSGTLHLMHIPQERVR